MEGSSIDCGKITYNITQCYWLEETDYFGFTTLKLKAYLELQHFFVQPEVKPRPVVYSCDLVDCLYL